ncbi:MFS transporter [Undibacterium sp.]|uniref:MFS transporter n=1 Tax=Undibacterium sp. TaxID=1914977 RepID=UPI00374DA3D9
MSKHLNANVWRLAAAQALAGANATVVYATGALVGNALAPTEILSTLPISIFVAGMAASTLPAGALANRFGRRPVFLLGALFGVLLGVIGALAIMRSSFALFCVAMPFGGAYAAIVLTFRFAATESVPPESRAHALSFVMAAGVLAGVVGPQLVIHTMDNIPLHQFAATYIASGIVAFISAAVLYGVSLPKPAAKMSETGGNLLAAIRHPQVILAIACGAVSYTLMNFLMTSAPLAMKRCGLPLNSASLGLQWHVIAMYGPGFFTGKLISKFGAPKVVMLGFLLTTAAVTVGMSGLSLTHFWASLVLLGAGWNLGFIGASSMLVDVKAPVEKTRLQALNDFIIFGCVMVGSLLSGGLLARYGWQLVCFIAIFPVAVAALLLVAMIRVGKREGALS